jgi:hypothetical protein
MKKVGTVVIFLVVTSLPVLSSLGHAANYTLIPRLRVDSYYTDNLFLTRGDKEEDIVTTVFPGITAGVSGQTAGIDVTFNPGYTFYKNNDDRNYWRFNAGLDSFLDITQHTTLTVTDFFYLTRDPDPEDQITGVRANRPGAFVDPTIRQGRAKYWRNTFEAQVDHEFGKDKTIYARYRNGILRNDNNVLYQDSDVNTGTAGVTYFFGPKWGTELGGTFSRRTFDQTNDFTGTPSSDQDVWRGRARLIRRFTRSTDGFLNYTYANVKFTGNNFSVDPGFGLPTLVVNEDYDIHDVRVGADYAIEEDILLTASAGWAIKVNDVTDNQDGFVGELTLRKTLRRGGFRVGATAGYDTQGFNTTAQNLGLIRFYGAGVTGSYQLFRSLYGDAYGRYRHNKYIDTIPERTQDLYTAGAGLTWQPFRWGSVRLGYSYRSSYSGLETEEYTENRIFLNLSLSTELPYEALF